MRPAGRGASQRVSTSRPRTSTLWARHGRRAVRRTSERTRASERITLNNEDRGKMLLEWTLSRASGPPGGCAPAHLCAPKIMDGLETLSRIKVEHPNLEVVMLTGHATVENAIEGMKGGAFDYLMKPCPIDLLVMKVDRAVIKKREHEGKILEARAHMIALRKGY